MDNCRTHTAVKIAVRYPVAKTEAKI